MFDMKQLEGKKVEEIYGIVNIFINSSDKKLTNEKLNHICQSIKNAPGNVAWVIYLAKHYGWWNEDNDTTCQSIKDAQGNVAWAIYKAKHDGWWVD